MHPAGDLVPFVGLGIDTRLDRVLKPRLQVLFERGVPAVEDNAAVPLSFHHSERPVGLNPSVVIRAPALELAVYAVGQGSLVATILPFVDGPFLIPPLLHCHQGYLLVMTRNSAGLLLKGLEVSSPRLV